METQFGMQQRSQQNQNPPTYQAVGPLGLATAAAAQPQPPAASAGNLQQDRDWERRVDPVKHLDPGPGPAMVPDTIISVSNFLAVMSSNIVAMESID